MEIETSSNSSTQVWPPAPTVPEVLAPSRPIDAFPRQSIIKYVFLVAITGGLYCCYWYYKTNQIIDELDPNASVARWAIVLAVIFGAISLVLSIDAKFIDTSSTMQSMADFGEWWRRIYNIFIVFSLRSALMRVLGTSSPAHHLSRGYTFFFREYYLQHRINKLLDAPAVEN
ncbi:MAG TPA: DUF4234 domain-containing protein [Capsulimonadaceae bacterium]|jgi:hypothetical protein